MTKIAHSIAEAKQKLGDRLKTESPVPTKFKVGDKVIFTNDAGIEFKKEVLGFAEKLDYDRFIFIFTDCWWFPTEEKSLRLDI